MGANSIIVKEYLESLKEDNELDYLFPLLLSMMGYKIITTAKESKGQSQYGKDVVAINKDENGKEWRYYFQIKAGSAKDINDTTFNEENNGIRSSLIQAKYANLTDFTKSGFENIPVKYVLVHPGILKENFRPVWKGFIETEFNDDNIEDWHIYKLIELFENHLFNECLLIDNISYKLFKRALVLLDAPDNDYADIKLLVDYLINYHSATSGRKLQKLFTSFHLISAIIKQYSKDSNNLHPAREALTIIILKVWAWILKNKLEKNKKILEQFRKLLKLHFETLHEYFTKTYPVASSPNGLFAEGLGFYEEIGYPLRSYEYLGYLLYYFETVPYSEAFEKCISDDEVIQLRILQREHFILLINNNSGCSRPVLDRHSIPIVLLFIFFIKGKVIEEQMKFIKKYIIDILYNISLTKVARKRYPMVGNNLKVLAEYSAENKRPEEYNDGSSILIPTLFEIITMLNLEYWYNFYKCSIKGLSLQIPFPNVDDYEEKLFEGHQNDAYAVETFHSFPESFDDFRNDLLSQSNERMEFRTDKAGFPYLRILAHLYYKNELPPSEWRSLFNVGK